MPQNKMFWPLMKNTISFADRLAMAKFCLLSKRFTNGPKVREFEREWSNWVSPNQKINSVYVNSGGSANLLLLDALKDFYGLEDGAKVLVPAMTWSTNVAPVIQVGLEPVFCDLTPEFQWDLDYFNKHIKGQDISIVFTTHLFGIYCSTKKLKDLLPNALYIHDVCESHGVKNEDGVNVGNLDYGATFSFYFGHHMTTVEGGMVSVDHPQLHDLMRVKRSHGLVRESDNEKLKECYEEFFPWVDPKFMFSTLGYNLRNTELGAVLGLRQLKRLDKMITRRQDVYSLISKEIEKKPKLFEHQKYDMQSSFCIPLVCKDIITKTYVEQEFNKLGIETRPLCSGYLPRQPFLTYLSAYVENTNVEDISSRGFFIGNNHLISNRDIKKMRKIIKSL